MLEEASAASASPCKARAAALSGAAAFVPPPISLLLVAPPAGPAIEPTETSGNGSTPAITVSRAAPVSRSPAEIIANKICASSCGIMDSMSV